MSETGYYYIPDACNNNVNRYVILVQKILKGSLDLIPSRTPSLKIQIMGGKVCLRYKGKTLLGIVNELLKKRNVEIIQPYYLR